MGCDTLSTSQRDIFNQSIECSRVLVEFYFFSQYDSHDQQTLGLMSTTLRDFHHFKDVFRQFRMLLPRRPALTGPHPPPTAPLGYQVATFGHPSLELCRQN